MIHQIKCLLESGGLKRLALKSAVFLAGVFSAQLLPVNALLTGDAAKLELGQPSMTQGYQNAVTGAGAYQPTAIAVGSGRLYSVDTLNNRVLWWNTSQAFANGRTADGVIGQPDLFSALANQGVAPAADTLFAPSGVALDGSGNVWVADTGNNRVLRFPAPAANGPAADRVLGQADFITGGPNRDNLLVPGNKTLYKPQGMWFDATGNLWVADASNNRVLMFPAPLASDEAATLVLGQPDYATVTAGTTGTGLTAPGGVSVDASGNVWVADTFNSRVLLYNTPAVNGVSANMALGQADLVSVVSNRAGAVAANTMSFPQGVMVNGTTVWVADTFNNRMLNFNNPLSNGVAATFELGQADLTGFLGNRGNNAASSVALNGPTGAALLGTDLWVADASNNRVVRYLNPSANGNAANVATGQLDLISFAVNVPSAQSLYSPAGLAVHAASGRVFAADAKNNRVLWWNSSASFANRQPADGVLGQANFTSVLPNRGAAAGAAALSGPSGVAADTAGNLWVLDAGNTRVLRFAAPLSNGQAANRVIGQANFSTTGGATGQATLLNPAAITLDNSGRLWVADSGNNRVLRFADFSADGPNADFVLGQTNYTLGSADRGGTAAPNSLNNPVSVSVDRSSNVWVADSFNSRVLRYGFASFEAAFAAPGPDAAMVLGQADFVSALADRGGAAAANSLDNPGSAWVDAAGNAWVTDTGNGRALRYDAPFTNGEAAVLALGQADLTSTGGNHNLPSPDAATLSAPGYALNSGNKLWLADTGNNRLLQTGLLYGTDLGLAFTGASSSTLTAAWASITGSSYVVVLASDINFTSIVSSATQFQTGGKTFTGLVPGTTHYLEVKLSTQADNGFAANFAAAATSLSITPLAPVLTAPSLGNLTASWSAVSGPGFVAVLATDSGYTAIVSSSAVGTGVYTKTFGSLANYATYYFQVKISSETDISYAINRASTVTLGGTLVLTSVSPNKLVGGTGDIDMTVIGSGFIGGATLKLTRAGKADVDGTAVTVAGPTRITAKLPQPIEAGLWNLSLTAAGQTTVLPNAVALLGAEANSAKIYQGIFKPLSGEAAQLTSALTSAGQATIRVYDNLGRLIRVIFEGYRPAGNYLDAWDGKNDKGSMVASGIYLVRFNCPGFNETKRVVVIK